MMNVSVIDLFGALPGGGGRPLPQEETFSSDLTEVNSPDLDGSGEPTELLDESGRVPWVMQGIGFQVELLDGPVLQLGLTRDPSSRLPGLFESVPVAPNGFSAVGEQPSEPVVLSAINPMPIPNGNIEDGPVETRSGRGGNGSPFPTATTDRTVRSVLSDAAGLPFQEGLSESLDGKPKGEIFVNGSTLLKDIRPEGQGVHPPTTGSDEDSAHPTLRQGDGSVGAFREETDAAPNRDQGRFPSPGEREKADRGTRHAQPSDTSEGFRKEGLPAVETEGSQGIVRTETASVSSGRELPEVRELLWQVAEKISLGSARDGQAIRLRLHPEQLGAMRVELLIQDDRVEAEIVTSHGVVKDLLEGNLRLLREALAEQGLRVDRIFVSVGDPDRSPDMGGRSRERWHSRSDRLASADSMEDDILMSSQPIRTSDMPGVDLYI